MAKKLTPEEQELKEKERLRVVTKGEVRDCIEGNPDFGWYIIQTYAGKEAAAKRSIEERLITGEAQNLVSLVLLPENVKNELRSEKMKLVKHKLYPGYLFIHSARKIDNENGTFSQLIDEKVYTAVIGASSIHSFAGQGKDTMPKAISKLDVRRIIEQLQNSDDVKQGVEFKVGEEFLIKKGAFKDVTGTVVVADYDTCMLTVEVAIFGTTTTIQLSFEDALSKEDE